VELIENILTINGIKPIPAKVEIIMRWLPPKNVNELRSFLGTVGYYRKFIPSFAIIAAPLKKGVGFGMDIEEIFSFDELNSKLIVAPILSLPII